MRTELGRVNRRIEVGVTILVLVTLLVGSVGVANTTAGTVNSPVRQGTESYVFVSKWGSESSGNGEFDWPWGVARVSLEVLAAPPTQGTNLLKNPAFEEGFWERGVGEVTVANGWQAWWVQGSEEQTSEGYLRQPKYKPEDAWVSTMRRVHSGRFSQKYFNSYSTHIGGIYQQVAVAKGSKATFSIWVQVWSSTEPDVNYCEGFGNYAVSAGIDPYGGTDGNSGNIVWSDSVMSCNQWVHLSVSTVAQADEVTVFTRGAPEFRVQFNDSYWDDAVLTAVAPTPRPTNTPGLEGKIAFASDRDGNFEIYVMNADGTGQVRLTDNPADDGWPSWSPDGRRIAFVSDRDGNWEIYVMNADGTGQVDVTNSPTADGWPSWSPDGRKIAFVSDCDGNWEIYAINADGTEKTKLTTDPKDDGWPTWSPDGRRIAFAFNRDRGYYKIYVMNGDGTEQTRLTDWANDFRPAWSPDGRKIAFASNCDGNWEIYVMNADGTGRVNLTNNPADDSWPSWSPDGERIAFQSDRDGNSEIYVMNADGTGQVNLTNNLADDLKPSWSPYAKAPEEPAQEPPLTASPFSVSITPVSQTVPAGASASFFLSLYFAP